MLSRQLYVVVEEEIDEVIGLVVSEWPVRDGGGRLHFDFESPEVELGVDLEELEAQLRERQIPDALVGRGEREAVREQLRRRPVVVGDTFALRPRRDVPFEELPSLVDEIGLAGWIEVVADITADAREEAGSAMYEALTPPVKDDVAEALLSDEQAQGLDR